MKMDFQSNKCRHHLKRFSNILYLCLLYLCELIYFNNMQHQIGQSDRRDVSQLLPDGGFQVPTHKDCVNENKSNFQGHFLACFQPAPCV